jgi:hypothetical protein
MNLKTEEVNKYLKKIFNKDEENITIVNNMLFELINKLNNSIFEKYFSSKKNFKEYIINILKKKVINEYGDNNIFNSIDEDAKINIEELTEKKITNIYNYLQETDRNKKLSLLYKFNQCIFYPKHKKGDLTNVENYRFLTKHSIELKVIDRIISDIIMTLAPNIFDPYIYKAQLKGGFGDDCIKTATNNTLDIDNVLLLDISKAFDSVKWKILYENMILVLSTSLNLELTISIVNEYFLILQNREFIYKKNKKKYPINVTIGISQGLPSSNIIFSLLICSIVEKWKINANIDIDIDIYNHLKLNIYIDDFYIKFFNTKSDKNMIIVNSLINELENHSLIVNKLKSLADTKLQMNFTELKSSDSYLGIPFTRDLVKYKNWVMIDYQSKQKNKRFIEEKKFECTWISFYNIIKDDKRYDIKRRLIGYLRYKLTPIIKYYKLNIDNVTDKILIDFIHDYFIDERIHIVNSFLLIILLITFIGFLLNFVL